MQNKIRDPQNGILVLRSSEAACTVAKMSDKARFLNQYFS